VSAEQAERVRELVSSWPAPDGEFLARQEVQRVLSSLRLAARELRRAS
jgi:hypothetical protein